MPSSFVAPTFCVGMIMPFGDFEFSHSHVHTGSVGTRSLSFLRSTNIDTSKRRQFFSSIPPNPNSCSHSNYNHSLHMYKPHHTSICVEQIFLEKVNSAACKGKLIVQSIDNLCLPCLHAEPLGCPLHANTVATLRASAHVEISDVTDLIIAVDGGHDDNPNNIYTSTWALACVAVSSSHSWLIATQAGQLSLDSS